MGRKEDYIETGRFLHEEKILEGVVEPLIHLLMKRATRIIRERQRGRLFRERQRKIPTWREDIGGCSGASHPSVGEESHQDHQRETEGKIIERDTKKILHEEKILEDVVEPLIHLLVKRATRIIRVPTMVMTAHSTERIVIMIVHILNYTVYFWKILNF